MYSITHPIENARFLEEIYLFLLQGKSLFKKSNENAVLACEHTSSFFLKYYHLT